MRTLVLAWLLLPAIAAALPPEFPTAWEAPPGDPVELETAGLAKLICSAVFIGGQSPAAAIREDGSFVSVPAALSAARSARIDRSERRVTLVLPDGRARTAALFADQGCVLLPRGADRPHFQPRKVPASSTRGPEAAWPTGDRLPGGMPGVPGREHLEQALDTAFAEPGALTAAVLVAWRGQLVAERYGTGVARDTRLPSWSMGKSLAATLMGRLIHEGEYRLWQPAPIPQWQAGDDPRRRIRIADLMRMSGGLRFVSSHDPEFDPARGYADHDYVYTGAIDTYGWAVTRPPQWPAGTVGRYRNSDPLALGALMRQAVEARGEDFLAWPRRTLLDRIGMRNTVLETDAWGNFVFTGFDLGSARDWLRLGLLYLRDGVWEGERLLPEGFVDFVRTPAPAWERPEYGGLFWLNRTKTWPLPEDAFYMAGAGGQYVFIVPSLELVVVRMGRYRGAEPGERALREALPAIVSALSVVERVD